MSSSSMYDVTPLEPFGAVVTGLEVRRQPEQSVMEWLEHDLVVCLVVCLGID